MISLRDNMTLKEKYDVNYEMDENFKKLNVFVENYPDLKVSENFKILQQSVIEVEEHLQVARRLYNSNVSAYNQLVVSLPACFVAKRKGMAIKDFFEASNKEKENVKVDI